MMGDQFEQYCDTELCLTPGGRRTSSPSSGRVEERAAKATHEQQQITICYGSRVCVCDVTELQARAIICMAKQEMAESSDTTKKHVDLRRNQHMGWQQERKVSQPASLWTMPASGVRPHLESRPAAAGLSMTRSLQRFLLNRKTRAVDQPSDLCGHAHNDQAPP